MGKHRVSELDDPWEQGEQPHFLFSGNKSLQTRSGYWIQKKEELTAILSAEESSSSSASPSYVGVRKTFEFHLKDGTGRGEGDRTDWIMHEYHHLRKDDDEEVLFLEEGVVLRKVSKKHKTKTDQASSLYYQVDSLDTPRCNAVGRRYKTASAFLDTTKTDRTKLDDVWNYFTRIRSANYPDEVYAACHGCDKVLKAHPKDGTSHLRRHIKAYSSCSKSNPSTDDDREMLRRLRLVLDNPYELQRMDCQADLTKLDPWDLVLARPNPWPWYVTRSLDRQTQGGHWNEVKKARTAIRMDQQGSWEDIIRKEIAVIQVPKYMGLRRTYQFHHQDGRKTDWFMLEYQQLNDGIKSPALLLQEGMVLRKVFRYDKHGAASALSELDRLLNGDDDDEGHFIGEGVNTDIATPSSDCVVERKRKRTGAASSRRKSQVWMYFTRIYNTDHGLVYVVCDSCDRGYTSGSSTNGTTHLTRHAKRCASKHPRSVSANDATTEWEQEIWPRFLPHLRSTMEKQSRSLEMFRNITNEEADHWNPLSDNPIIPTSQEQPFDAHCEYVDGENNAQGDPFDANDEGDEEVQEVTPSTVPNKRPRVAAVDRKKAKSSTTLLMVEANSKISDASSSFVAKKKEGISISEIMEHVKDCGASYDSDEYDIATQLFVKEEQREMFMTLPTKEIKLNWLRKRHNDKYGS